MSRISDRTQILMGERWRDSIRPEHRHDPNWTRRKHGTEHRGDIIAPLPPETVLSAFWAEFMRPCGWVFD